MRSFQEIMRGINVRWLIKKTLRLLIYCLNPFRLIKFFFYFIFGSIFLGMLTLMLGNYANAAEWVPAGQGIDSNSTVYKSCYLGSPYNVGISANPATADGCKAKLPTVSVFTAGSLHTTVTYTNTIVYRYKILDKSGNVVSGTYLDIEFTKGSLTYVCPPDGNPDYTFGPKVTEDGTICEKAPIQCLTGSIKDTNVITGKEFCRPLCEGIAGSTLGDPDDLKTYIKAQFGSVQIQCYGQCSVVPVGGSINVVGQPNVWQAVIKFTGEKCPVQHNGEQQDEDVAGTVEPPKSSDATGDAQNQLQNAASSAISNTTSGATGTSTLNDVVDKLAETSNKEIKAGSEQNAALGKVIQEVGKDIQSQIKEAQLSQSQGSAGASMGQIQTANAIKDGNAKMGEKLDAIKDAIENQDKGEDKPLPPGVTAIETDAGTVYTNRNDWASRNYNTVLQQHVASLKGLPMFEAVGGFFQVNTNAGTCPQFTIDVPDIGGHGGGSLVFDAFCDADLAKIFAIIALCIKLAGMYVGFRIAILD